MEFTEVGEVHIHKHVHILVCTHTHTHAHLGIFRNQLTLGFPFCLYSPRGASLCPKC